MRWPRLPSFRPEPCAEVLLDLADERDEANGQVLELVELNEAIADIERETWQRLEDLDELLQVLLTAVADWSAAPPVSQTAARTQLLRAARRVAAARVAVLGSVEVP